MPADRRALLLGILGVVAALALAWNLIGSPDPVPPAAGTRGGRAATAQGAGTPVDVRLEALTAQREAPGALDRNPFRFEARRAPAGPPSDDQGPERPSATGFLPPRPAGPPQPAPIPLKFFGVVERSDGVKVAALTDGRTVMHGREGDIIEGRYRILSIGVESIEVAYVDGSGRQTIRLTGQ